MYSTLLMCVPATFCGPSSREYPPHFLRLSAPFRGAGEVCSLNAPVACLFARKGSGPCCLNNYIVVKRLIKRECNVARRFLAPGVNQDQNGAIVGNRVEGCPVILIAPDLLARDFENRIALLQVLTVC